MKNVEHDCCICMANKLIVQHWKRHGPRVISSEPYLHPIITSGMRAVRRPSQADRVVREHIQIGSGIRHNRSQPRAALSQQRRLRSGSAEFWRGGSRRVRF